MPYTIRFDTRSVGPQAHDIPDATVNNDGVMTKAQVAKLNSLSPTPPPSPSSTYLWTVAKTWTELSTEIVAGGGGGVVMVYADPLGAPRQITNNPGDLHILDSLFFIGVGNSPAASPCVIDIIAGWTFRNTPGAQCSRLMSKQVDWIANDALLDASSVRTVALILDAGSFGTNATVDTFPLVAGSGSGNSYAAMHNGAAMFNFGAASMFDIENAAISITMTDESLLLGLTVRSSTNSGTALINVDGSSDIKFDAVGQDVLPLPAAPDYPGVVTLFGQSNGLTGPAYGNAQTTGATPIDTSKTRLFPMPFSTSPRNTTTVVARVQAINDVADEGTGFVLAATFKVSAAGVITQAGAQTVMHHAGDAGAAGWTAVLMTDGATIFVRVTGQGGKNVDWDVSMDVNRFSF